MINLETKTSRTPNTLHIPEETHLDGMRVVEGPVIDDLETVFKLPSAARIDVPQQPPKAEAVSSQEGLFQKVRKFGKSVMGIFRRSTPEASAPTLPPIETPAPPITEEVLQTGVIGDLSNIGPMHGPENKIESPAADVMSGRSIGENEPVTKAVDSNIPASQARTSGIIK